MEKGKYKGSGIFTIRKYLVPLGIFLSVCIFVLLRCSEEMPSATEAGKYESSAQGIIYQYHKLYAEIESLDMFMSPIISARFLMTLNIAIREATKASSDPGNYQIHFSSSDHPQKYVIKDTLLLKNVLNAVLSDHLSNLFSERVQNSAMTIEKKYAEIHDLINTKSQKNGVDYQLVSNLTKIITDSVKNQFLHEDYILKSKYSLRDSISEDVKYDSKRTTISWVKSMKRFQSIMPDLGMDSLPYLPKLRFSPLKEKEMYIQAMEIYALSKPLPQESKWVAEFWSDDLPGITFSPVTRWISILNQLIAREKPDFETTKNIYFFMSLAIHETGVQCWEYKYNFRQMRPSHFIQSHIDPSWKPFHDDPDFPAYPSGHSAFGAAACSILENYFGKGYSFTDNSHKGNKAFLSEPRNFVSFQEMKEENAKSRMYLGVHFRKDCEDGLILGDYVAENILRNYILLKLRRNPQKI